MESKNAIFLEDVFPWIETQESHSYKRTIEASSTDDINQKMMKLSLKEVKRGLLSTNKKKKICKLVKSLYSLKQAPKQ